VVLSVTAATGVGRGGCGPRCPRRYGEKEFRRWGGLDGGSGGRWLGQRPRPGSGGTLHRICRWMRPAVGLGASLDPSSPAARVGEQRVALTGGAERGGGGELLFRFVLIGENLGCMSS
jgi:hypothetical protein